LHEGRNGFHMVVKVESVVAVKQLGDFFVNLLVRTHEAHTVAQIGAVDAMVCCS
jgi:hypothetical protein